MSQRGECVRTEAGMGSSRALGGVDGRDEYHENAYGGDKRRDRLVYDEMNVLLVLQDR